jgi:hypothetical protein
MAILFPTRIPVLTVENFRVAEIRAQEFQGQVPDEMSVVQWITMMDQYINGRTHQGVTTVSLDKESPDLAQASVPEDFIAATELSCTIHNAQPKALRSKGFVPWLPVRNGGGGNGGRGGGHGGGGGGGGGGGCTASATFSAYWWGCELYLNHCACNDVELAESSASAICAIIAKLAGGIPGIVLGIIGAFLAGESAWLQWADGNCGYQGAYLDQTWAALGIPWIRTVC